MCRLVQISTAMGLRSEDFKELGEHVVTLFRFLMQPIVDSSEENEAKILSCVSGLMESGYSVQHCEALAICIGATFESLRHRNPAVIGFEYINLPGANLARANLENADLTGAEFAGANFESAAFRAAILLTKDSYKWFRTNVEKSVESNPAGILPLLLAVTAESLDKIDSWDIVALKKLG